ncbi:MAG: hypothetical protein IPM60_03415 [Rhodospirillales bacterium]|nr:hypothetical protein [Rhodospirillales bacterium]
MIWLTEDAVLCCDHEAGLVRIVGTQDLVTVAGRAVLVQSNPESRPIVGCPNVGPTIKPCLQTLKVEKGYSAFVRIDGKAVCLDTVSGLTDGTPPGTIKYSVRSPGQALVGADG